MKARTYLFTNGAKLIIKKEYCRIILRGGVVGIDITRQQAIEALTGYRKETGLFPRRMNRTLAQG